MKYTIEEKVTRFTKRFGMVMDPKTMNIAKAEADEYEFRLISPGHYAVIHGSKMYIIIEREGQLGCSCEDMTFNRMNGAVCKHIITFSRLVAPVTEAIDDADRGFLVNLGWTGRELHPEEIQIPPPDPDPDIGGPLPEPKEKEKPRDKPKVKVYTRTCKHCGEIFEGTDLDKVKRGVMAHTVICPENPANLKTAPEPAMMSGTCQYCGKVIKRKLAADLKVAVEGHETTCTKRPKEQAQNEEKKMEEEQNTAMTKPEQNTAVAQSREMPSQAEFQKAQVERILKNQGSIYKVGTNQVPDSAAVSNYAIGEGVSTETIKVEQTKEYALAIVRAHKGSRYVDASVLIRKDAIVEKTLIDLAEKNPKWIKGWAHGLPDFDLNQMVHVGDKRKILGLHIAGIISDAWMFAPRNCETKAGRRAQVKILGSDWRETDETADEQSEVDAVQKR